MKNLKLKAARAAMGLSQQGLADRCGVSRQTIVAIEGGGTTTPPSTCAGRSAGCWAQRWTSCSGRMSPMFKVLPECHNTGSEQTCP